MDQLHSWACSELSILGMNESNQIVSYLMDIKEENTIKEYLNTMLDLSNPDHKHFICEFTSRVSELNKSLGPGFYRKPELNEESKSDLKGKNRKEKLADLINCPKSELGQTKKKNKFVSLYSEEGENRNVILLPGRHQCDCQASKHKLINNCLNCGRIVCEQEGSGPCAFCKNMVASKEEREIINKGTKRGEALQNKLIHTKRIQCKEEEPPKDNLKALLKAIEHKNILLEYDQTSEKRTKVYDDENDYFQTNSKWLNPANREMLQKLEEEMKQKKYDRSNKKVIIDLLGRKILEEGDNNYNPENSIIKELLSDDNPERNIKEEGTHSSSLFNLSRPIYIENANENTSLKNMIADSSSLHRIQDRGLQEMCDEGLCLSMHQPWASLLTTGIKIHEGRTWYSSHRGRLWIASAAKVPNTLEVAQVEQQYRVLFKNDDITFPLNYPPGCLLGCIDLVDVVPQEEYRKQFPLGESNSPYVFVCENPKEMVIKFPVKGEHKIYKLDSKIHGAAKKALIP